MNENYLRQAKEAEAIQKIFNGSFLKELKDAGYNVTQIHDEIIIKKEKETSNITRIIWKPMETFPKEYINDNTKEVLLKTHSGIVSAWACIENPTNEAKDDGCYDWICYDDMFTMDFDDITIEGWCEITS